MSKWVNIPRLLGIQACYYERREIINIERNKKKKNLWGLGTSSSTMNTGFYFKNLYLYLSACLPAYWECLQLCSLKASVSTDIPEKRSTFSTQILISNIISYENGTRLLGEIAHSKATADKVQTDLKISCFNSKKMHKNRWGHMKRAREAARRCSNQSDLETWASK